MRTEMFANFILFLNQLILVRKWNPSCSSRRFVVDDLFVALGEGAALNLDDESDDGVENDEDFKWLPQVSYSVHFIKFAPNQDIEGIRENGNDFAGTEAFEDAVEEEQPMH